MMEIILTMILFWVIFFTVTFLTHYIYITKGLNIKPWSYWDKYPFVCYKCCTTWFLVTTYIMSGILLADVLFTVLGVTLAGLYGYGLYKLERERMI